ncbi:MAG: pyridoxamine 5'-phosphate oxidase family protein [Candidatus Heimdallarchaeota archaeon]
MIPKGVSLTEAYIDLLKDKKIGYLNIITPIENLVTVPVAFFYHKPFIFFGTPRNSKKIKFLRKNPKVSLTIDNGEKSAYSSMGIQFQGQVEIYDFKVMALRIVNAATAMARFAKKYPELFTFYFNPTKQGYIPSSNKIYKYCLSRIKPTRIVCWNGKERGDIYPEIVERNVTLDDIAKYLQFFTGMTDIIDYECYQDYERFRKKEKKKENSLGPNPEDIEVEPISWGTEVIDSGIYRAVLTEAIAGEGLTQRGLELLRAIYETLELYRGMLRQAMFSHVIYAEDQKFLEDCKQKIYETALNAARSTETGVQDEEQRILDALREQLELPIYRH